MRWNNTDKKQEGQVEFLSTNYQAQILANLFSSENIKVQVWNKSIYKNDLQSYRTLKKKILLL